MRYGPEDVEVPEGAVSTSDKLVELLKSYRIGVYLCIISVAALLLTGRWSIPSLPPWLAKALTGYAIGIIPATILGKKAVVDRFIPDTRVRVMEWDIPETVEVEENTTVTRLDVEIWKVPQGLWDSRERGRWPEWSPAGSSLDAVVTDFNYSEDDHTLRVEGLNEEISNPADIAIRDGQLAEIYRSLLDARRELTRVNATIEAKALEIESKDVNALVEAVEHGAAFQTGTLDTIRDVDLPDREPDAEDRDRPDEGEHGPEGPTLRDVFAAADGPSTNGQTADTDGGDER